MPFGSRSDAHAFFAKRFGGGLAAEAWTSGLEQCEDGWRPRFAVDGAAQTLRDASSGASWEEWESIACPTLVVRAGNGLVDPETARKMIERLPGAQLLDWLMRLTACISTDPTNGDER